MSNLGEAYWQLNSLAEACRHLHSLDDAYWQLNSVAEACRHLRSLGDAYWPYGSRKNSISRPVMCQGTTSFVPQKHQSERGL